MRYLVLALLLICVPCCASRKHKLTPTPSAEAAAQLDPESTESQMIAARAHLEMGCPTDASYQVSKIGKEYQVQVKYVTGYDSAKKPIHATNRGALVVLDHDGKLVRIDRGQTPALEVAQEDAATASG
jgi:hypothetical protein